MIAVYGRVCTPDQNLSRQIKSAVEFSTPRLGAELDGGYSADTSIHAEQNALALPTDFGEVRVYVDKLPSPSKGGPECGSVCVEAPP